MPNWDVSPTQDYLLQDGRPFFYLADTAWAAFSNLSIADWARYLAYRKMQGFTAMQISILPITHDTSMGPGNVDPFLPDADGNWDFNRYNEDYFAKAETMVQMTVDQGLVPVLGILWCSYVPGTRCSQNSPVASAMPFDAMQAYAGYAAKRFKPYNPMFFISGDTHFESPEEEPYYMAALEAVKAVCPDALLTMHLSPRGDLPRSFMDVVDFYMYQSGHHAEHLDRPYLFGEKFSAYPVKRPIVNSEPPYEGHGRVGERTRFNAFDIRKATWQSLLSGAKMGVTYGAHGVWSFHHRGLNFLNAHRSFEPFSWDEALTLPGAWDVGFAKWLFETYNLFETEPASILRNEDPEIRAAASPDHSIVAVYVPYTFDLDLDLDLTGYDCIQIDLTSRRIITPEVQTGPQSRVGMLRFNADSLFLARRD
ncbi:DUF4038 domain-containing protein [bacterium]|nr:DUF4038 domain-containing protein [bacterium]